MGGFRFSLRNASQVTGVVALGAGWALHKVSNLDWLVFVLLGIGLVCVGIAAWHGIRFRRVVAERSALARNRGWRVVRAHGGFVEALRGFPFGQGRKQEAQIVAFGPFKDTYAAAFTYEFTRGSGRFAHIQEYDVVVLELPRVLPDAYLLPRDSVEGLKTLTGFDRSTFELFDFNERWTATGPDKRFVHALVHPLLIEALLRIDDKSTPICLTNGALYTWTAKRLTAAQSREALQRLDAVRQTMPPFVWEDFGGAANRRLKTIYGDGDSLERLRAEQV